MARDEHLAEAVAAHCGMPKDQVEEVLRAFFHTCACTLEAGEKIVIENFGTLRARSRSPVFRHVPGLGVIELPERKAVTFRPSENLIKRLNEK